MLAALLAGGLVQPLHHLGAPHVVGFILPLFQIALALTFGWAVLHKRLSVRYKRGEVVVLLALLAPLMGLAFVNLYYTFR